VSISIDLYRTTLQTQEQIYNSFKWDSHKPF